MLEAVAAMTTFFYVLVAAGWTYGQQRSTQAEEITRE
jgi:hypothetical protein